MALTIEEKQELIQDVINEITTQSTSIDELQAVSSLDETESLPAYQKNTTNLVKVPISLISKPAVDAAASATSAASSATSAANEATKAKNEVLVVKNEAQEATSAANEAAERANEAMDTINQISAIAGNADAQAKELKKQLKDYNIETTTESGYENLETKDDNTLYFCTEDELS